MPPLDEIFCLNQRLCVCQPLCCSTDPKPYNCLLMPNLTVVCNNMIARSSFNNLAIHFKTDTWVIDLSSPICITVHTPRLVCDCGLMRKRPVNDTWMFEFHLIYDCCRALLCCTIPYHTIVLFQATRPISTIQLNEKRRRQKISKPTEKKR